MKLENVLVVLVDKQKEFWFQTYARLCLATKAKKINKPLNFTKIPHCLGFHDSKTVFGHVEFPQELGDIRTLP